MPQRNLRVVRLLEPELCSECRFSKMASVAMNDGRTQRMVYCRRLDCDNWDYTTAEAAEGMDVDEEAA
jgi:hypothetical protein